jgi:hypothetical protein
VRITHLVVATALALAAPVMLTTPALAADTSTTFTVAPGALTIAVPGTANLATAPHARTTAQLGTVTVTDQRAVLAATWKATVSFTGVTTGGRTAAKTVADCGISYWSGMATATTGTGVATPGQATSANAVALGASATAFSWTAQYGSNAVAWNPMLTVTKAATGDSGCAGTVTHSVA